MDALKVSVIIEWENVLLSEMARCQAMLRALHGQIHELHRQRAESKSDDLPWLKFPFQVMVVYDEAIVQRKMIDDELARVFQPDDPCIQVTVSPSTGLHYYELKNFGAQRAEGDIVLFLDSDVIPESGWLKHLLVTLSNPEVEVVSGATYVDPVGLLGKTFALTWFFSLRSGDTSLVKVWNFFANNVAFRKKLFARFLFPGVPGADRGSCGILAQTLRNNNVTIYRHNGARVSHPPPNGLRHFVVRALAHGRDGVFRGRVEHGRCGYLSEAFGLLKRYLKDIRHVFKAILQDRKTVHLSLSNAPAAVVIGLCYYHFRLFGGLMAQLFPRFMTSHFRI